MNENENKISNISEKDKCEASTSSAKRSLVSKNNNATRAVQIRKFKKTNKQGGMKCPKIKIVNHGPLPDFSQIL